MGKMKQPNHLPQGGKKRATPQQRMAFGKAKIKPENLFNTADIMQLFSISESSVKRWRKQRVLPYVKMGGTIYYLKDVIFKMLTERTIFPER